MTTTAFAIVLFVCAYVSPHVTVQSLPISNFLARSTRSALRRTHTQFNNIPDDVLPKASFFQQPLDHFNAEENRTFQQRYFVNETFVNASTKSTPLFVYIDGEGASSARHVVQGHHMQLAAHHHALVIAVEHRYYGASVPVNDLSTANLRFLSSEQALADLARFITFAYHHWHLDSSSKVITFGGSYAGALSAWSRIKYPHLVYASVSTSGPVHAVEDFFEYNTIVAKSLSQHNVGGSTMCVNSIRKAFIDVESDISRGNDGLFNLAKKFNSCEEIILDEDITTFVSNLAGVFQGIVQYNNQGTGLNIEGICRVMTNTTLGPPIERLAALTASTMDEICIDNSYKNTIEELQQTLVNRNETGVGERQWLYQTCSEFGYYQTCKRDKSCIFSQRMTLATNTQLCKTLFQLDETMVRNRVMFSNENYGANRPAGSRIVFVNGNVDPWHSLSVIHTLSSTQTVVFVNGTSHCQTMANDELSDPIQLTKARVKIGSFVSSWLQDIETKASPLVAIQ